MPDGLTHERIRRNLRIPAYSCAFVIPSFMFLVGEWKSGVELSLGAGIFLGYEMGKFCTPDWDIMGTTSSEGWMVNEVPVLGHFLFGVSSTYGSIFRKQHRSFITHFPFISTSVRHLFLFWWIWYQIYWSTWELIYMVHMFFVGLFIGNAISDGVHWYLDVIKYPKSE